MNRADLEEFFHFDGWVWDKFGESLDDLPPGTLERPAPGSGWPALRNCLGHIPFGYNAWLSRLDGGERIVIDLDAADWPALDAHFQAARARFRAYIDSLSDDQLQTERDVVDSDGTVLQYTPAEVLTHILFHGRAHHGDMFTLYHQLGHDLSMPLIDYRYYVEATRR
jgi:uncharacterized damage-inducible protein DinB